MNFWMENLKLENGIILLWFYWRFRVPVVLPEETIIALSEETDKFEAELELLVSFSSNETSTEKLYNSEELSSYNIFQCCVSAYSIPDKKNITVSIGERSWGFPVKLVQMPVGIKLCRF